MQQKTPREYRDRKGKIVPLKPKYDGNARYCSPGRLQPLRKWVKAYPSAVVSYCVLTVALIALALFAFFTVKNAVHSAREGSATPRVNNAVTAVLVPGVTTVGANAGNEARVAAPSVFPSSAVAVISPAENLAANLTEKVVTVKGKNDNLNKIFKRLNLSANDARKILNLSHTQSLYSLRAGQKLTFYFDSAKQLAKIIYPISDTDTLVISRASSGARFQAKVNHVEPVVRLEYAGVTVTSSLSAGAKKAGVPGKLIGQFLSIFKDKVNLEKTLRSGDSIDLLYRDYYIGDKKIKSGEIALAEYTHGGKTTRAIAFTDGYGRTNYYSADGYSLKSPFVRYPLKFKRISSPFSLHRYHPIYHIWCAHTGVDLSATYGAPVKATSDGVIAFAGVSSGYGRTVTVKHDTKYSTLYAHLSGFASDLHRGSRVQQGQVVGYVGNSGETTGTHLHFEFRINNQPNDPTKVKLPSTEMIAANYRSKFLAQGKQLLAKLDTFKHAHGMVAVSGGGGGVTSKI